MTLYLLPFLTALMLLVVAAAIYRFRVHNRRVAARLKKVVEGGDAAAPTVEFVSSGLCSG